MVAENPAGSLALTSGQSAVAERGKAPGGAGRGAAPRCRPVGALLPARRLFPPGRVPGRDRTGRARSARSLEAYAAGDLQRAFDAHRGASRATVPDPRFFAYRASLLLAVGRVDEAGADIAAGAASARERRQRPGAADDHRGRAGRARTRALHVAQQAVRRRPKSGHGPDRAVLRPAGAVRSRRRARQPREGGASAEPENALAWARLAELQAVVRRPRRGPSTRPQKAVALAAEPRRGPRPSSASPT